MRGFGRRDGQCGGDRSCPEIFPSFGIPLIARASASNWAAVEMLLELTLASLLAQTDEDLPVVIAGHDRPDGLPDDPRITFLTADWPAAPPRSDNADSGRKKYVINAFVREQGGGYLMFVDADDWADTRTVETARRMLAGRRLGGLVTKGFATDLPTLRSVELPHPRVFDRSFHRICGSCMVALIDPAHPDPLFHDPYGELHEHYLALENARARGHELLELPLTGTYLVNTSENHSETHGPFADWRRSFSQGVVREGRPMDAAHAARFGLSLDRIRRVSRLLGEARANENRTASRDRSECALGLAVR